MPNRESISEDEIESFSETLEEIEFPVSQLESEPLVIPQKVNNVQMKVGKRILPKALEE